MQHFRDALTRSFHVIHLQATIELETQKRPWVPQADEHQERAKSLGTPKSQRTGSAHCLTLGNGLRT